MEAHMIISVFQGSSTSDALKIGDMHFERAPSQGEQVAIGTKLHLVRQAWHMPSALFAGAKFAVLVSREEAKALSPPALAIAAGS